MWDLLTGNEVLMLFVIIGVGMLLGNVRIYGLSLGSSGVLFAALVAGHLGVNVSAAVGRLGLVLFVYCVGIAAGPSFFRAFVRQGKQLAILALVVVGIGAVVTIAGAWLTQIPGDLAVGIFAGALTSTPALATAVEVMGKDSAVSIGYGIAYPFGVVGVVLFVQLLPRILGADLSAEASRQPGHAGKNNAITGILVKVNNPSLAGKSLDEVYSVQVNRCAITRVLRGERLMPAPSDYVIALGDMVWLVGSSGAVEAAIEAIGERSDQPHLMDTDRERRQLVVTASAVVGESVAALRPLRDHEVIISRITRNDVPFVPSEATILRPGDVLTCVGLPERLEAFATVVGHRPKAVDETDIISLAVGVTLGILVGLIELGLPGGRTLSLGMAGGPLLVALLLSHFGRVGRITGSLPRASRILMSEIGLVFFLAWAGTQAGGSFVEVVQAQGITLLILSVVVVVLPMTIGYIVARRFLKMDLLQTLGGMCGGMTSTPGLGAITSKTDADAPVVSYAAAYPVALIFMTLAAKLIIALLATLTA